MKDKHPCEITIHPTSKVIPGPDGLLVRVWEGMSASGLEVVALMLAVGVASGEDPIATECFKDALIECDKSSEFVAKEDLTETTLRVPPPSRN